MMSCPLAPVSDVVNKVQNGKAYGAPTLIEMPPPKRKKTLEDPGALDQLDITLSKVCVPHSGRSSPILIKQLRSEALEPSQKEHYGVAYLASCQALRMERHSFSGSSLAGSCAPSSYRPNVLDSFACSRNDSPIFGAQAGTSYDSDQYLGDFAKATSLDDAEQGEECFPWSDDEEFALDITTCAQASAHQDAPSQAPAVECKGTKSPSEAQQGLHPQRFSHAKAQ